MKKRTLGIIITLLAMISITGGQAFASGPYAPPAGQPGTTAIHMNDASFVAWANGWTNYVVGTNVDAGWQTPNKALGQAVGSSYDIVCLGRGGQITLTFPNPIVNGTGADFAVFENSFSDTFLELGWVEVSGNGTDFVRFPNDSQTPSPVGGFGSVDATNIDGFAGKYIQGYGTPFDLDDIPSGSRPSQVTHVRIVDIVGDGSAHDSTVEEKVIYDPYPTVGSAGFDLDAIGVINELASANQAPTDITMSSQQVLEEESSGTVVGTLSAEDPDAGDTHTFSLVSGSGDTDNSSFTISGSSLQTNAIFDYETKKSYSIRVEANDGNGGTYQEALTIGVIYKNFANHAGLVLDYGDGTVETLCVDLGGDGEAMGWEALQDTGRDIEREGWGICNIESVGCPANDCFCGWDSQPYEAWNFWHLSSDSSEWIFAGDAVSDTITTGEVDGWSWGEWSSVEPDLYTFDEICHKHTTSDFNDDGTADILLNNTSTGANSIWFMDDGAIDQTESITSRGSPWEVLAIHDFNGDIRTDIFWQNSSTGSNEIWLMDGSTVISQENPGTTSSSWQALGAGDFSNDADADMAWIDTTNGDVYVSLMSDGVIQSSTYVATMNSPWKLIALDDFDGDSKADFAWQNTSTGVVTFWFMDGATRTSTQNASSTSTNMALGAGDINGDGKADIVWRYHPMFIGFWFMNGATVASTTTAQVPVPYTAAGIEDLNGDGMKDILWRNPSSGANVVALWNGSSFTTSSITTQGSPWKVVVPGVNVQTATGGAALVNFEAFIEKVFIGTI